jgi:hypothetical protein
VCAIGASAIVSGSLRMLQSACAVDVADAVVLTHVAHGSRAASRLAAHMDAMVVEVVGSDDGTVTITVESACGVATSSAIGATAVDGG